MMTSLAHRRSLAWLLAIGLVFFWLLANQTGLRGAVARNAGFYWLNRFKAGDEAGHTTGAAAQRGIDQLRQATRLSPDNDSAWRALGYVLLEDGNEGEALSAWRQSGGMAAELLDNGVRADAEDDTANALAWYQRAVAVDPTLVDGWLAAGLLHEQTGDRDAAASVFKAGLESSPDSGDLLYQLARMSSANSQDIAWEEVLALVERAISGNNYRHEWSRHQAHYLRGEALRNLGRPREALAEYVLVTEALPDNYWAVVRRAELTWEVERDAGAAEHYYRAAMAIDPESKWAYRHFARDLAGMGRYQEARVFFEKVLVLDPADQVAARWLQQNPIP